MLCHEWGNLRKVDVSGIREIRLQRGAPLHWFLLVIALLFGGTALMTLGVMPRFIGIWLGLFVGFGIAFFTSGPEHAAYPEWIFIGPVVGFIIGHFRAVMDRPPSRLDNRYRPPEPEDRDAKEDFVIYDRMKEKHEREQRQEEKRQERAKRFWEQHEQKCRERAPMLEAAVRKALERKP